MNRENMKNKIESFSENPNQSLPTLCEICGCEISDGDECWYVGDGVYICSSFTDECIKKWEK